MTACWSVILTLTNPNPSPDPMLLAHAARNVLIEKL